MKNTPPKRKKRKTKGKLTEKAKRFAKEYLVDLNATQAAKRAGYSKKTAYSIGGRLLKHVEIQKAIAAAFAKRSAKTEITAEYILTGFREIFEKCAQKVPVMRFDYVTKELVQVTEEVTHADGTVTEEGVWQFDSRGANTALTKLGEHLGLFKNVFASDPDNPLFPPIEIIMPRKNGVPLQEKKVDEGITRAE